MNDIPYDKLPKTLYKRQKTSRGDRFNAYPRPALERIDPEVYIANPAYSEEDKSGTKKRYIPVRVDKSKTPPTKRYAISDNRIDEILKEVRDKKHFSFHYLDSLELESYEPHSGQSLRHDSTVIKTESTSDQGIGFDTGDSSLSGNIGDSDTPEQKHGYISQERSVDAVFYKYLTSLIDQERVTLGLELEYRKPVRLLDLEKILEVIKQHRFEAILAEQSEIEKFKMEIFEGGTKISMEELRGIDRVFLMSSSFHIIEESPEYYKLVFTHPDERNTGVHFTIESFVKKSNITKNWIEEYRDGRSIRVNFLGFAISSVEHNEKNIVLELKPIAIYR